MNTKEITKEKPVFVRVFKKEEIPTFEAFKKTEKEKIALKIAKAQWRDRMRKTHPQFTDKKGFKFPQF
jgi:hypothetical protein